MFDCLSCTVVYVPVESFVDHMIWIAYKKIL